MPFLGALYRGVGKDRDSAENGVISRLVGV